MTKLDEIAKALGTYSVHQCRVPEGVTWWVLDRGNDPAFNSDNEVRAIKECARLNARAVLKAMREPTEEMILAAGYEGSAQAPQDRFVTQWTAAIDCLLKSP